jgi:hypothetical protein
VTTPDDRVIDSFLIGYVSAFVPNASGEHFNPHVSTGLAPRTYLDKLLAEPFVPFTFSPAGAAVYQLGQFGTEAKKLRWPRADRPACFGGPRGRTYTLCPTPSFPGGLIPKFWVGRHGLNSQVKGSSVWNHPLGFSTETLALAR